MAKKLSISIVHHHGLEMLRDCLTSIFENSPNFPFEVLVVDNASTDGAVEMIEHDFPAVKLLKNSEQHGFGHNQNAGIAASTGEYIFIYNDDTLLHGQALTTLCDFLDQHSDVGLVGPRLLNADNTLQLSCYKFPSPIRCIWENTLLTAAFPNSTIFGDYRKWQHDQVRAVDFVIGAAMLVRRSVIDQVGTFDENFFMYSEETDWQMRIHKAGWKIMLCPDAVVTHLGGQSSEGVKDRQFCEFNRSAAKLMKKHYGSLGALVQRFAMIEGSLIRLLIWSTIGAVVESKKSVAQKNIRTWGRLLKWWCGMGPHEGLSSF
ncbi:MAG: glycosyltransferase family 2 protein [Candidatus Obscuribacterales bacterium]